MLVFNSCSCDIIYQIIVGMEKKIIGILVDIFFVIVFMLEIIEIYWWYINVENNGNYLLKILSTEICLKWLFYIIEISGNK